MKQIQKEKTKQLNELTKREVIILYLNTLIGNKRIITPEIKTTLLNMGFKMAVIGTKKEHEINSKELKENFCGYDIAIGLAAVAVSYGSGRKYTALVINLDDFL